MKKLKSSEIAEFMTMRGIHWTFNPPYASHFGGVWERLIRSIRRILKGLLLQQRLTEEGLVTLMCEVEAVLNSRPLTSIKNDAGEPSPLTPTHLLTLRGPDGPPCLTVKEDVYARKRWRQVQYMADVFWRRWVAEYLPTLQEKTKWTTKRRNLKVDDIVLVVDDKLPRCSWMMGRVVRVHADEKGIVRKAWIKTQNGEVYRPLSKLCLLQESEK